MKAYHKWRQHVMHRETRGWEDDGVWISSLWCLYVSAQGAVKEGSRCSIHSGCVQITMWRMSKTFTSTNGHSYLHTMLQSVSRLRLHITWIRQGSFSVSQRWQTWLVVASGSIGAKGSPTATLTLHHARNTTTTVLQNLTLVSNLPPHYYSVIHVPPYMLI